jgi:glycerol-3-phosphate dehydrogenase (NAD(P)+)
MESIVIIGAGSLGTAFAAALAQTGRRVTLWGRNEATIREITERRTNEAFLPGVTLPPGFDATTDRDVAGEADLLLLAVPSRAFREVSEGIRADVSLRPGCVTLSGTKGIELATGLRMTEVLREVFPDHPAAVISGPSHAEEVARSLPTALVIGSADVELGRRLQELFTLPWLRTYTSRDVVGVEIGGTVKNIVAIAGGIVEGLGMGDNAKAGLVTRGLAEMVRIGVTMGAQAETFMGLSGVGDLMVTCFSNHSRNTRFGRMLGQGLTVAQAKERMSMVAEGVPNSESVYHFARKHGIRTPVTDLLHDLIQGRLDVHDAARRLLSRSPRAELD